MSTIPRQGLLRDVAVMRDTVGFRKLEQCDCKKPWTSVNIFALHTLYVSFILTTFEGLAFGR